MSVQSPASSRFFQAVRASFYVWASPNEGDSWYSIAHHLPHIYAVEVASLAE